MHLLDEWAQQSFNRSDPSVRAVTFGEGFSLVLVVDGVTKLEDVTVRMTKQRQDGKMMQMGDTRTDKP